MVTVSGNSILRTMYVAKELNKLCKKKANRLGRELKGIGVRGTGFRLDVFEFGKKRVRGGQRSDDRDGNQRRRHGRGEGLLRS